MKNYKLPVWGCALMLLMAACKKEDVRQTDLNNGLLSGLTSKLSQWNTVTSWSSAATDDGTTFFSNLPDSAITSEIANGGLVLVFRKTGSAIQALPVQEKDSKTYWYYQVAKGSLRINADNNEGKKNLSAQSFSYFVITPEKLSALEAGGKTKLDLLQLSYTQAVALLK
jgi:hypothetical protein